MELMNALAEIPGVGWILPYVSLLMALSSVLATIIPPTSVWYRVVNALASNVGQARNAGDPKVSGN